MVHTPVDVVKEMKRLGRRILQATREIWYADHEI